MRHLLQIILVIIFFLLPVYLDFLQVNMFTYLYLGFGSTFPAPLISTLVYLAALYLLCSYAFKNETVKPIYPLAALIILAVPVIILFSGQTQLNSTWAIIGYAVFFILLIICGILLFKNHRPAKSARA